MNVRTHRVPLGVRVFLSSGLLVNVGTTLVHQSGSFFVRGLPEDGSDTFSVVDLAAGYRLPKRYGVLRLEIRNLFDEAFKFQDIDPANPTIRGQRVALVRVILGN